MRTVTVLGVAALALASAVCGCADGRMAGALRVLLSDDAFASGVVVERDGMPRGAAWPITVDPLTAVVVGRGTRTSLADFADAELVVVVGPRGDLVALDERTMRVDLVRVEGDADAAARLATAVGADLAPAGDGAWELLAPDPWSALIALGAPPAGIERVLPVLLDPLGDLDAMRVAASPDAAGTASSGDPTLPSASLLADADAEEPELLRRLLDGGEWTSPRARAGRGRITLHAPRPGRFAALSWIIGGGGCGQSWESSSRRQLTALELGEGGAATMCGRRQERSWLGGNAGIDYGEDRTHLALAGSWREVERGTIDVELGDAPGACPGAVAPRLAEQELLREPVAWRSGTASGRRIVLRCVAVSALDDGRWGDELLACRDVTPTDEAPATGELDTGGDLLEGSWVLLGRGNGIAMFGEQTFWDAAPPTRVVQLDAPATSPGAEEFPAALRALGDRSDADNTRGHCAALRALAEPLPPGEISLDDGPRGPRALARLQFLCAGAAR